MSYQSEALHYLGLGDQAWSDVPVAKEVSRVYRKGERCDHTWASYVPDGAGAWDAGYSYRSLWDGAAYLHRQQAQHTGPVQPPLGVYSTDQQEAARILFDQNTGAFLEGRFWHNMYAGDWTTVLKAARGAVSQMDEQVDGYACRKLTAQCESGDYTLWIDPAYGYNLRRAHIVVGPRHLAWGRLLGEISLGTTKRRYEGIEMTVEDISIAQIGEHHIPAGGTLITALLYSDGAIHRTRQVVTRHEMTTDPDFDALGAFVMDLPDGTVVRHRQVPGIAFRWSDGTIRPDVDSLVVNQLDRTAAVVKSDLLARRAGDQQERSLPSHPAGTQRTPLALRSRSDTVPAAQDHFRRRVPWLLAGAMALLLASGLAVRHRRNHGRR